MRDHIAGDPVHPDVPDIFQEACASIFTRPMDPTRLFVCRGWVEKPLEGPAARPSPACFIISAQRLDDARDVAICARGILNYVYFETRDGRMTADSVNAVIETLRRRMYLLSLADAILLFEDIGVPVFHGLGLDKSDLLVVPLLVDVGFQKEKVERFEEKVPNKW